MIALWHPESKTLYAADAIVGTGPKDQPLQIPITVDFPILASHSFMRLSKLPVKHLLLAHGGSLQITGHDEDIANNVTSSSSSSSSSSSMSSPLTPVIPKSGTRMMNSLPYKEYTKRMQQHAIRLRNDKFKFNRKGWKGIAFNLLCSPIQMSFEYRRVAKILAQVTK